MKKELEEYLKQYELLKEQGMSVNMARGKPCFEQLELSMELLDVLNSKTDFYNIDNIDIRNYGAMDGLREAKELFSDIINIPASNIIVYGNSSLQVMFDLISQSMTHGVLQGTPWMHQEKIKWLCPVPGYDRHFSITEYFGIEMINIPMNNDGPCMDIIEELVKDETVKGIWCCPMYSNPSGITYSDKVVRRLSQLKPKSKDFRIYWDNAYCLHHLYKDERDSLLNIYDECKKNHNEDLVYVITSTSKLNFPGGGICCIGGSDNNINSIKNRMKYQILGFDKVNQMRQCKFLKNLDFINNHMNKQADIIRPKFDIINKELESVKDICKWTKPKGGYFISLDVMGCAKEVVKRCSDCGVILTDSGSSFPYHYDPMNSNIRIAPTYPKIEELIFAAKVLVLSIRIETLLKKE